MKIKLSSAKILGSIITTALLLTACGSDSSKEGSNEEGGIPSIPETVLTAVKAPLSTLTQEAKDTLSYMGNEERLAYDVYMGLYDYHINNSGQEIKQLTNIASKAEKNHIKTVQLLVDKYISNLSDFTNTNTNTNQELNLDMDFTEYSIDQLPAGKYNIGAIQNLYDTLMTKGIQSKQDALEVGCMIEVVDINDLEDDLVIAKTSQADDIVVSFEYLRDGSYKHYWSFDKGLKNMGISEGCCSIGSEYCHTEYPR